MRPSWIFLLCLFGLFSWICFHSVALDEPSPRPADETTVLLWYFHWASISNNTAAVPAKVGLASTERDTCYPSSTRSAMLKMQRHLFDTRVLRSEHRRKVEERGRNERALLHVFKIPNSVKMVSHTICGIGVPSFWLSQCVCELTTQSRGIPRALCDTIHIRNPPCPPQRSPEAPIWPRRFRPDTAVDNTSLVITTSYHGVYHLPSSPIQTIPFPPIELHIY